MYCLIFAAVSVFACCQSSERSLVRYQHTHWYVTNDEQCTNKEQISNKEVTERLEIRKTDKIIPIIALTAGTIKGEKEKCIETGMNDYISKPIIKEVFENILLKWLQ